MYKLAFMGRKGWNVKAFGYSILGLLPNFYVVDSEKQALESRETFESLSVNRVFLLFHDNFFDLAIGEFHNVNAVL